MAERSESLHEAIAAHKIRNVYARYCIALDTHAWQLLEKCFMPDAEIHLGRLSTLQNGSPVTDLKGWQRMCADILPRFSATQHFVMQSLIDVDGDTANSRCYFVAHHVMDGAPKPYFIIAGWYTDRFVRQDDEWLIAHRVGTPVWYENVPQEIWTVPTGSTEKTEGHGVPRWLLERPEAL